MFPVLDEICVAAPVVICENNVLSNGDINCTATNLLGSVCSHSCNEGFLLVGQNQTTCVKTGLDRARWSPAAPICSSKLDLFCCQNIFLAKISFLLENGVFEIAIHRKPFEG